MYNCIYIYIFLIFLHLFIYALHVFVLPTVASLRWPSDDLPRHEAGPKLEELLKSSRDHQVTKRV